MEGKGVDNHRSKSPRGNFRQGEQSHKINMRLAVKEEGIN